LGTFLATISPNVFFGCLKVKNLHEKAASQLEQGDRLAYWLSISLKHCSFINPN
jgi:hypothetical protein